MTDAERLDWLEAFLDGGCVILTRSPVANLIQLKCEEPGAEPLHVRRGSLRTALDAAMETYDQA